MATLMRADFPKLYASRLAYLRMLIGPDAWKEADQKWTKYFTVLPSTKMKEEMLMWGGFGLFHPMEENEAVTYDNMLQGPQQTWIHSLYGLGFSIGYLPQKDDLDGLIAKYAPELGRSQRVSIQTLGASFWNGVFATYKTADGVYYASRSHTFVRGGSTWVNMPASGSALGMSSLETGIISFMKQRDLMNNPMPMEPTRLLVPPDLVPTAHELLKSQLRPDTTTNASNFLNGIVPVESWEFLTSSTAWFLLGDQSQMKVYWFWHIQPDTSHGYDFDREAAKTKTLFSCSFGALDARGSWCNAGA